MSEPQNVVNKARKKREKPVKKWSEAEVILILDFILERGNFEKPTAQFYYKKLLEETKIEATWDLVRWKVRNLKLSFNKTTEWRKSTGASLLETEGGYGSVKVKIAKLCPHYDRLTEIFGDKSITKADISIYESGSFNALQDSKSLEQFMSPFKPEHEISDAFTPATKITNADSTNANKSVAHASDSASTSKPAAAEKEHQEALKFAEKLKKCGPKSAINQRAALEKERAAITKFFL